MLATVAQLAAYLNVDADEPSLPRLLVEAESALSDKWGIPFVGQAAEDRTIEVNGYIVTLRDCYAVTAVTDTSGNELSHTVIAGERDGDPVRHIELVSPAQGYVVVTGTFGNTSTPASVARAIVVTAAAWYRRQNSGTEGNFIGGLSAIPKEADDLMRAWRGWTL